MFRSFFCFFANESARSLNFIEHAMEHIPLTEHGYQAQSNVVYGIVAQMEGQTERVTHELQEKLSNSPSLNLVCKLSILWALAYLHYLSGDADGAARYISRLREDSELHDANNHVAWSYYFDGLLHLQRGEWSSAIQLLEKASVHRYVHHTKAAADNLAALTLAYQANGQPEKALETLQSLDKYVRDLSSPFYVLVDSCTVRLALMQEQLESPLRWLEISDSPVSEVMMCWFEISCVTRCRALIAEGSAGNLQKAAEQLKEYAEMNEGHHNTYHKTEVLALQSVALHKLGQIDEALAALEEALGLAAPRGWVFPFVELGSAMADLLSHLEESGVTDNFVQQLLSAIQQQKAKVSRPNIKLNQPLIDSLTNRELEILDLLDQRLQNKEIASKLYISVETVKSHLRLIYQKLGTGGRREACRKAHELGILPLQ